MKQKEIQFGISEAADFMKNTWVFKMPKNYSVFAGEFALVPKDKFQKAANALNSIMKLAHKGNLDDHESICKHLDEAIVNLNS